MGYIFISFDLRAHLNGLKNRFDGGDLFRFGNMMVKLGQIVETKKNLSLKKV